MSRPEERGAGAGAPARPAPTAAVLISFDEERASDSPLIERVWRSHSERAGTFLSIAACHWEMVVTRHAGQTSLTVRGPETRASTADCPGGGEWLAIRFRLGTFMPAFPPASLRDCRTVTLPAASSRAFWLASSAWEYPGFESAEAFVDRLCRHGLIRVDPVVTDVLCGGTGGSTPRTAERHFLRATGLTQGAVRQIERARLAIRTLRAGGDPADATFEAGYFDQAHLTRSLRRFAGQTPSQVRRGDRQLSFLYKTEPSIAL